MALPIVGATDKSPEQGITPDGVKGYSPVSSDPGFLISEDTRTPEVVPEYSDAPHVAHRISCTSSGVRVVLFDVFQGSSDPGLFSPAPPGPSLNGLLSVSPILRQCVRGVSPETMLYKPVSLFQ